MSDMFKEWDKAYDAKEMKKDVEEAAKNGSNFDGELPVGTYPAYIKAMEVKATKNNEPMLAVQLKITDDDATYKGRVMFANFMLNKPFLLHKANEFLRGLGTDVNVEFDDYGQYKKMVDEIFDITESGQYDFDIAYTKRDGKYDEYKVTEVYSN